MDKMKAVLYYHYGMPDVLTNGVTSIPQILDNQVLVKTSCSGINPVDYKIRQGKFKLLTGKKFPKIPGADFSGIVEQSSSPDFKKGDAVMGMNNPMHGGCYAEYIRVSAANLIKIPKSMPMEEAAALPLSGLTALQSLRDKAELVAGKKILIIGASGGVGIYAVQIARILGATVTAVCSNRNAKLVESLGADRIVDYTSANFKDELEKYDVVFDIVNSFHMAKAKKFMNPGSIYIMTSPGPLDIFSSINPLNYQYHFKTIVVENKKEDLIQLLDWYKEKKLKVVIDKVFQFNDAANAHIYGESHRARGKLVLKLEI